MVACTSDEDDLDTLFHTFFFAKPGDIVEPVTNHTKRAGFVITSGEIRDQAVERAEQIVESIKIETVPVK